MPISATQESDKPDEPIGEFCVQRPEDRSASLHWDHSRVLIVPEPTATSGSPSPLESYIHKEDEVVVYLDRAALETRSDLNEALKRLYNIDRNSEPARLDQSSTNVAAAREPEYRTPLIAVRGAEHIQASVLSELVSLTQTHRLRVFLFGGREKLHYLLEDHTEATTQELEPKVAPVDVRQILQNKPTRQLSQYKAARLAALCTAALWGMLFVSYLF